MATENELIEKMQRDTALVKRALGRIAGDAAKVVTLNHEAGRHEASADAMAWQSEVHAALALLLAAHGRASGALLKHYGGEIVAAGPIR
jgi:hypothetical protein